MKSKSIGSLILLAIVAPSCGSGGGNGPVVPKNPPLLVKWQTQQRSPTSSDLRGVIFANTVSGIVAGRDGSIFRTDDGGDTWTQQEFTPTSLGSHLNAISANGQILVAAGQDIATGNGRFYTGIDSAWWTTDPAPATGAPFVDANASFPGLGNVPGTYWMLRSNGTIDYNFSGLTGSFTTLDLTPPPPPVHVPPRQPIDWQECNSLVFIGDTGYGLVCGRDNGWAGYPADPVAPSAYPADPGHPAQGQVIRTTDNGGSWLPQQIVPANTKTFRRMFVSVTTAGAFHAYLCGDDAGDHGIVLATNPDVADQWKAVLGTGAPATAPRFRAINFPVNDELGYVAGDGGTIYRITATVTINAGPPPTRDYAYTWTPMTSNTTEDIYSLSFLTKDLGYAVGNKGTVLKITNASTGTVWTNKTRGTPSITFNASSFTQDGMKGIAVGNAGAIFRTLDGGVHWTQMLPAPTAQDLLGAAVPAAGAGTYAFACGTNNTLLVNNNVWAGGAWAQATTIGGVVGTETYRALLFPQTEAQGICVGARSGAGVILRTTAADGTAWDVPTPGATLPSASYYGLTTNPGGNTVYASGGSNGKISVTSDLVGGWDSWGDAGPAFPSAFTLSSIASPEGSQFKTFVSASDGNVWRLSAGGTPTWSATPAAWIGAIPSSIGFQGQLNGVTVTDLGGIFTTGDSGTTWVKSYAHTQDKPRALWMSRAVPGLGYIVGDNGLILKTLSGGR